MTLADAIEIRHPDPDSHFRLVACRRCGSDKVAYQQYRAESANPWRVRCSSCGHTVDKGVRQDMMHRWRGTGE